MEISSSTVINILVGLSVPALIFIVIAILGVILHKGVLWLIGLCGLAVTTTIFGVLCFVLAFNTPGDGAIRYTLNGLTVILFSIAFVINGILLYKKKR